jgi:hypothetical protein
MASHDHNPDRRYVLVTSQRGERMMRDVTRTIAAAAVAAGLAWSGTALAMGGGGYGGPAVAVTVPPLGPAFESFPVGPYCATPTRNCMLHSTGYVGGPCSCHVRGGRAHGHIAAQ